MLKVTHARWPEPNAGWRDGMCGEAYLSLDFFRSLGIHALAFASSVSSRKAGTKRTKEKLSVNTLRFWYV